MTSLPLVSVLIPVFNRAHLITQTLQSNISQTYFNWECVVVDDSSTDITLNVLHRFETKGSRFTLLFFI